MLEKKMISSVGKEKRGSGKKKAQNEIFVCLRFTFDHHLCLHLIMSESERRKKKRVARRRRASGNDIFPPPAQSI